MRFIHESHCSKPPFPSLHSHVWLPGHSIMLQLAPRQNYVHLSGRSEEELYLRPRTICLEGKLSGQPFQAVQEQKGRVFHHLSPNVYCFSQVPNILLSLHQHVCRGEHRADPPTSFGQKHCRKCLILLNREEFPERREKSVLDKCIN